MLQRVGLILDEIVWSEPLADGAHRVLARKVLADETPLGELAYLGVTPPLGHDPAIEVCRTDAILAFSNELVEKRGWASDASLDRLREVGLGDAEIAEVVATVALNTFTNYFNHVAGTEVDFPAAAPLPATS